MDDGGWEQDESRPGTGLAQDDRNKDDEEEGEDVSAYHDDDPSGRMSPSFYDEEGELMVRIAAHCAVLRCPVHWFDLCLSVALCLYDCMSTLSSEIQRDAICNAARAGRDQGAVEARARARDASCVV